VAEADFSAHKTAVKTALFGRPGAHEDAAAHGGRVSRTGFTPIDSPGAAAAIAAANVAGVTGLVAASVSPAATEGTSFTSITGYQEPT
jgi:hypothetical protein